jgi:hypothetical protein
MLVGRCKVVGSTNDLNPASLTVARRIGWESQDWLTGAAGAAAGGGQPGRAVDYTTATCTA